MNPKDTSHNSEIDRIRNQRRGLNRVMTTRQFRYRIRKAAGIEPKRLSNGRFTK